ncbi:MAG: hypothetical protein Q8Q47_12440 [Ignavibacteriaceae bacterium]|nr:hypothetical protein [Ignavibacteriaceae bacterium]
MRKILIVFVIALPLFGFLSSFEDEITTAHLNAKKGIYFGLKNVKDKKVKFDNKIVDKSKLIAIVKVSKEINGVRVEATGYHNSTEVTIVVYRSYVDLVKDGYIRDASDFPNENFDTVDKN